MVLGFELLFSSSLAIRPPRLRFVPAETWIGWSGIALTSVGAFFNSRTYGYKPVSRFLLQNPRIALICGP